MGGNPADSPRLGLSRPGETRFGVRVRDTGQMRRIAKMAGTLFAVVGANILFLWASVGDGVAHPGAYVVSGLAIVAIGGLLLGLGFVVSDANLAQIYVPGAIIAVFTAALLVPIVLYFVGFPTFAFGTITYAVVMFIAFYVLARWLAAVSVGVMVAGQAVLNSVSDGVVGPVPQLVFIFSILLATAVLFGGLMVELDQARRAEAEANATLAVLNQDLE